MAVWPSHGASPSSCRAAGKSVDKVSEFNWPAKKHSKAFWAKKENRQAYLTWFEGAHEIRSLDDWYQVNIDSFYKSRGTGFLNVYDFSVYKAIKDLRPDLPLRAWNFLQVPSGFWSQRSNRLDYIQWLGETLGFKSPEDWYRVSTQDIKSNRGNSFLKEYPTLFALVSDLVPANFDFLPWKFKQVPKNFWKKMENRRSYLKWLGQELGFEKPEDWYLITRKAIVSNYGNGLFTKVYDSSPYKMVNDIFPEFHLKPWLFGKTNSEFWNETENIKQYVEWLADQLGYDRISDWYQVTKADFQSNYGGGLISKHSYKEVLEIAYPEAEWLPWKFGQVGHNFWTVPENRSKYVTWLGDQLGIKNVEDWRFLTPEDLASHHGLGLYDFYGNNLSKLLEDSFGRSFDDLWLQETRRDTRARSSYWGQKENRVNALRSVGDRLGFTKPEDWYQLKMSDLAEAGFSGLAGGWYQGSTIAAVQELFPQRTWIPWLFNRVPNNFWNSTKNQKAYLLWLQERLGIESMDQWYSVTSSAFHNNFGGRLISIYGNSPKKILSRHFEEIEAKDPRFDRMRRGQRRLYDVVRQLFPNEEVIIEYKTELRFEASNIRMEIDIYLPRLKFGFEYQGEQHFIPAWSGVEGLKKQQARDQQKRERFLENEYRVLEIDYTWDRSAIAVENAINAFDANILDNPTH